MKQKLLGFVVNNHKKELLTKLDSLGEFEVHYFCLKHLDYEDLLRSGIDEKRLFSYPFLKKQFIKNVEQSIPYDQVSANEKSYGIRPANRLISYNYDRSMLPSFGEKQLYDAILFEQEVLIDLINNIKPKGILGELSRSYYVIAHDLCKHFGVFYIHPLEMRSSYYGEPMYSLYDDIGDKLRFKELFDSYEKGIGKPSSEAINFASEFEKRIFNKSKFSSKGLKNFESGTKVFFKKLKNRIKSFKSYLRSYEIDRKYFAEKLTFKNQFYSVIRRFAIDPIRTPIVHRAKARFFTKKLDLTNLKYIYFPLHFYPELVSSVWSNQFIHFHDQELHLVQQISKNLPTGYKLLVKEHMPMVKSRKPRFYKKINDYYNTILLAPEFNSFELTEKSKCVITISSTTGFEALLKDIPVLTFVGSFYKHIPSVKTIDLNADIHDQIVSTIENFSVNRDHKLCALHAFYDSSCTFQYGDSSVGEFDLTYDEFSIKKIASYLKSFLRD